jgi:hypothetical protein
MNDEWSALDVRHNRLITALACAHSGTSVQGTRGSRVHGI